MIIFPAIDFYEGKAVRLFRGEYSKMTIYSDDTLAQAKKFEELGAKAIHLVDLEGARDGNCPNFKYIEAIAKNTDLFTEIGGGIRDMDTVERYILAGVDRVILGTAAVADEDFLAKAIEKFGKAVSVGADIRDGKLSLKGWTQQTDVTVDDFFQHMQSLGVSHIICTDISKDGAMIGTNRELYAALSTRYSLDITASGGVSSLEDIVALRKLNLYGAIIGKAYYTGALDIVHALEAAK